MYMQYIHFIIKHNNQDPRHTYNNVWAVRSIYASQNYTTTGNESYFSKKEPKKKKENMKKCFPIIYRSCRVGYNRRRRMLVIIWQAVFMCRVELLIYV